MSHNDKNPQTKKIGNIPFPKNNKKTRPSGVAEYKINKDTINQSIIKKKKEEFIIKYNDEIKTRNKFPPKSTRTYVRGKSVELKREKRSQIQFKKSTNKNNIQLKIKDTSEITPKKDLRQEIHEAKKEIVDIVKTEFGDLKNILIYGLQSLFSLLQNKNEEFEEKKKKFEKIIEISNQSNEKFKVEENTLKEDIKIGDSSKKKEYIITSENTSDKYPNGSNRNYVGTYNDSLEAINPKKRTRE